MKKISMLTAALAIGGCVTTHAMSESQAAAQLKQYAKYLEQGTYNDRDDHWDKLAREFKTRDHTFAKMFKYFEDTEGKIVVELGTIRSYVAWPNEGCLKTDSKYWHPESPEMWDWGAGNFTLVAATCLAHLSPTIHTVDIKEQAIQICKTVTKPFAHLIQYHLLNAESFLKTYSGPKIDLLYMDAGELDDKSAQMTKDQARIALERDLLSEQAQIVIDDVNTPDHDPTEIWHERGKGRLVIPYLEQNGFKVVEEEFQVIMRRS